MTPDDVGKLTLVELEAIAERLSNAVAMFREARALLGGGGLDSGTAIPAAVSPSARAEPVPPTTAIRFTPEELAQRERLKAQFVAGLPEEVQAAERNGVAHG